MATAQEVLDRFKETGTDIGYGRSTKDDGTLESANERAQRIAGEINAGRSWEEVDVSLGKIRNLGGTYIKSDAEIAAERVEAQRVYMEEQQAALDAQAKEDRRREVDLVYAWLPPGALDLYIEEYVESGSAEAAWAQVRNSNQYEQWFPGNLTEEGRPRLAEDEYAKTIASYDEVFINVGLNPDAFKGRYGELIRGEVSPMELEQNRINPMHDRIVSQSAQLREWYSVNYGVNMTDAALLGSAIDPDLGERILSKQISMAEIGGEALESGFDVSKAFAASMVENAQLDRSGAEQLFQTAETFMPILNVLANRHADPDDDFDLEEFVQADLFKDPAQMRRMRRLIAQERSSFTGGQLGTGFSQDRSLGGLGGLTER